MVHCMDRVIAGYNFQIEIVYLSLTIVFVLHVANTVYPDEMRHFIWVITICLIAHIGVTGIQPVRAQSTPPPLCTCKAHR